MERLYDLIENFTSYPGVSGLEDMAFDGLTEYVETLGIFDEIGTTSVGSFYGIMRCGKKNAPLLLCDAHLDTVGFVVTELCDDGFLRIAPIGGIAAKILPAAEVNIYGKKTIRGVFGSVPPHLQSAGDSEKKMNVTDLFIDTGLPIDELKAIVRVGTPVGFPCKLTKLLNDNLAGAGFDDRLCGAAIVRALMMLDKTKLNVDVAFQFSGGEETGYKGAMTTAYRLNPDKAIVIDVTHAFVPGAPKTREDVRAGNGGDICFSPQTNRAFTKHAVNIAEREGIPYQLSAAPGRTGTNSNAVQTTRDGIPTLLISIPLKNMHTMSEIVNMNDAYNTSRLIAEVIKSL
ncbi:MAG: M42 family metallopeptidase [Ruminococcaceae bacterium]|nr:M42 family metallopeptidase [Oscillospiraceae bacterium]